MAGGFTLKAKFICSRDTFISLPPFYAERYNYISNQYGVFKCVRSVECDDTHFLIDSTFAEKLGIEEDESIFFQEIESMKIAKQVFVEPICEDDWEIISVNAEQLEESFLKQVQCCKVDQIIPFYVGNVCLNLKVTSIDENVNFAILAENTEVIVKPLERGSDDAMESEILSLYPLCYNTAKAKGINAWVHSATFSKETTSVMISRKGFFEMPTLITPQVFSPHILPECLLLKVLVDDNVPLGFVGLDDLVMAQLCISFGEEIEVESNVRPCEGETLRIFCDNLDFKDEISAFLWKNAIFASNNQWIQIKGNENIRFCIQSYNPNPITVSLDTLFDFMTMSMESSIEEIPEESVFYDIIGSHGVGKTNLLTNIVYSVHSKFPYKKLFAISCKQLSALNGESLIHEVGKCLKNNACIIIDDIDVLLPEEPGESLFPSMKGGLADWLISKLESISNSFVFFTRTESMSRILSAWNLWTDSFQITKYTEVQRMQMIESIFEEENGSGNILDKIDHSRFVALDYRQLIHSINPSCYIPIISRISNQNNQIVQMDSLIGLEKGKSILKETVFWPIKYRHLYSSQLRPKSGILFYGFPGCGKTVLSLASASFPGVTFFSVKGPELLNKYIGSSEAAVRSLFSKARDSAPSIIFFDEFDSLAPKRGHDNTGVSDRVVNQLLTELDGLEGLEGVSVIAASSRPDLIDSALLRPGRIDESFLIDFPSADERKSFLSRHFKLNIDFVVEETDSWSFADLQNLASTVVLESLETNAPITKELITKGLLSCKPTLSHSEIAHFKERFQNFKEGKVDLTQQATFA